MSLGFVGADVLVGLLDSVANRASRTGTSGAGQETGQETRPTILSASEKTKRHCARVRAPRHYWRAIGTEKQKVEPSPGTDFSSHIRPP